jgi:hypothetical protein
MYRLSSNSWNPQGLSRPVMGLIYLLKYKCVKCTDIHVWDHIYNSIYYSIAALKLNIKGFIPLNAELNLICHLLVLLEAHHILHVTRVTVTIDNTEITNKMLMFIIINYSNVY